MREQGYHPTPTNTCNSLVGKGSMRNNLYRWGTGGWCRKAGHRKELLTMALYPSLQDKIRVSTPHHCFFSTQDGYGISIAKLGSKRSIDLMSVLSHSCCLQRKHAQSGDIFLAGSMDGKTKDWGIGAICIFSASPVNSIKGLFFLLLSSPLFR